MTQTCTWTSSTGKACDQPSSQSSTRCETHEKRHQYLLYCAQHCVHPGCTKKKARGLLRCRKHHLERYGGLPRKLEQFSWWPELKLYIEGQIQMGIRKALQVEEACV